MPAPDLRDDHTGDAFADPRIVVSSSISAANEATNPVAGGVVGADPADLVNLVPNLGQHRIEVVDPGQVQRHEVPMMCGEPPGQGRLQVLGLVPEHSLGQAGQHLRVTLAGDQRVQRQPTRDPEGVGGDVVQLDTGGFQHLQQSLGCDRDGPVSIRSAWSAESAGGVFGGKPPAFGGFPSDARKQPDQADRSQASAGPDHPARQFRDPDRGDPTGGHATPSRQYQPRIAATSPPNRQQRRETDSFPLRPDRQ